MEINIQDKMTFVCHLSAAAPPDRQYQRLGPGYSVIDQSSTSNNANSSLEMFKALADHIEKTLTENMEQVCMLCMVMTFQYSVQGRSKSNLFPSVPVRQFEND